MIHKNGQTTLKLKARLLEVGLSKLKEKDENKKAGSNQIKFINVPLPNVKNKKYQQNESQKKNNLCGCSMQWKMVFGCCDWESPLKKVGGRLVLVWSDFENKESSFKGNAINNHVIAIYLCLNERVRS